MQKGKVHFVSVLPAEDIVFCGKAKEDVQSYTSELSKVSCKNCRLIAEKRHEKEGT